MRWLRVKKDEDENGMWQCKTWPRTLGNATTSGLTMLAGNARPGPVRSDLLLWPRTLLFGVDI